MRRLQKSFQRFVPILLPLTVDLIDSRKQSTDKTKKNGNDIYQTETPQEIEQVRIRVFGECDRNGNINQDRRYHPADIHHHFMVEYNIVPGSFGLLHQLGYHPQNDFTADNVSQESYSDNKQQYNQIIYFVRPYFIHTCREQRTVDLLHHGIANILRISICQCHTHCINHFFHKIVSLLVYSLIS